jgi:penicillin-binding protein 2
MSVQLSPPEITTKNGYRFGSFVLAVVVAVTALTWRMADLELMQGQTTFSISQGQSSQTIAVPSSRGLIYDATGMALVQNLPNFTVEIVPDLLPLPAKPVVIRRLASLLSVDPVTIDATLDSSTGSMYNPIVVATSVSADVARIVDENHDILPGVVVLSQPLRQYTKSSQYKSLGPILGYTSGITDLSAQQKADGYQLYEPIGQDGLEAYYESYLRGQYGTETVALDSAGRPIPGLVTPVTAPVPGSSLKLSINMTEQRYAEQALTWGMSHSKVTRGVIIVENPQNGEILAMVSLPGYDDNVFAQGLSQADFQTMLNDNGQPLFNKAVREQYAPGSTYKLVAGTAGLQDGKITATSTIDSVPYITVKGEPFYEWNRQGWGPLNIIMGMAHSSDTFFYQLTEKVGLPRLAYWARQYGFGAPTGVDLPLEATGIVPDDQWKGVAFGSTMLPGEIIQAGIGQGFDASTPLQLLNAYCALANGGTLYVPHLVTDVIGPDGADTTYAQLMANEGKSTILNKLPASPQTLQTMRLATRAVVTSRHTYTMVDLPIMVAGKTGTAEFGTRDRYGRLPYHEWFVGYTPGDPVHGNFAGTDSKLAVLAFMYSANTWGDVSTEIVKYYMWLHYHLKGSPTNQNYPGAIPSWVTKTTNFYGSANNH